MNESNSVRMMMNVDLLARWHEFYETVTGHVPFAWQDRLVDTVSATGRWPDQIVAPTGAGKSSVVQVHAFVCAAAGHGLVARPPRRLITVVDRRALVDDQYDRARMLDELLTAARGSDTVMGWVAAGVDLFSYRTTRRGSVLPATALRGGGVLSAAWREIPEQAQIICSTPAMWGSRALFHGYGTNALSAPVEAAVAATDAVVVIDEAHLSVQLVATARRISVLQGEAPMAITPPLQVCVSTATPHDETGSTSVGIEIGDLAVDAALAARVQAPKPLTVVPIENTTKSVEAGVSVTLAAQVRNAVEVIAQEAVATGQPARPVLCVCNTVSRALTVAGHLRRDSAMKKPGQILLVIGPMRAGQRAAEAREHSYLYDPGAPVPPDAVRVVIATQTVEVGVDMDAAALVTELAPASALAQRFGRVNRVGARASGSVTVVDGGSTIKGPYGSGDLVIAQQWLAGFSDSDVGVLAVLKHQPPVGAPRRLVIEELSDADLSELAVTAPGARARPPALELWISDDLSREQFTGAVVVRDDLPADGIDALALLGATGTDPAEEFVAPLADARAVVAAALTGSAGSSAPARAFVLGSDQSWRVLDVSAVNQRSGSVVLRAGETVVLDAGHRVAIEGVTLTGIRDVAVAQWKQVTPIKVGCTSGLAHEFTRRRRVVWSLTGKGVPAAVLAACNGYTQAVARGSNVDKALAEVVTSVQKWNDAPTALAEGLIAGQRGGVRLEVTVCTDDKGDCRWAVIVATALRAGYGVELGDDQASVTARRRVLLGDHRVSVAAEARSLAEQVIPLVAAEMELAGLYHDDGKADRRFQTGRLGNIGPELILAKSGWSPVRLATLAKTGGILPAAWRHEQLSAAALVADHGIGVSALALRAVGASHGWGRGLWPRSVEVLLDDMVPPAWAKAAQELYGRTGWWHEVMARTDEQYGPWGAALAETVVRVADHRVSARGE